MLPPSLHTHTHTHAHFILPLKIQKRRGENAGSYPNPGVFRVFLKDFDALLPINPNYFFALSERTVDYSLTSVGLHSSSVEAERGKNSSNRPRTDKNVKSVKKRCFRNMQKKFTRSTLPIPHTSHPRFLKWERRGRPWPLRFVKPNIKRCGCNALHVLVRPRPLSPTTHRFLIRQHCLATKKVAKCVV